MSFQPYGPGKTAPKLFYDFLLFDPVKGKPNVLADHTPPHGEGPQLAASIGSCRHDYTLKSTQSVLPPLDLRPDGKTIYKTAVVCKKCRIHADVYIDHSNSAHPCPSPDHALHFFQRVTSYDKITSEHIRYAWQCSVGECRATLFILFRKARLREDQINLLINPELLKGRFERLGREEPTREGIRTATPMDSLARLRRYIKDSLDVEHSKRTFPANNKRFQEAFGMDGQDCAELLHRLGFKYAEHTWTLPNPEPIPDRLEANGNMHREVLEDIEMELLAVMYKLSTEEGLASLESMEPWSNADRDIERTLAAQGYTRHVSARRAAGPNAEFPFCNSLGAPPDFSDSLIEYAYDRQILADPERSSYYFECLQEISECRHTEQLQLKVATLRSQDVLSRRDILAAYRYLNIPPAEGKNLLDARVIEIFQAQQPDLSHAAQEEARGHLYKLGVARGSQALINTSRQSVETYEDALAWLGNGANKETPDDGILAILAIKTSDNPANEEIGHKAISTIARARHSNLLNSYLVTGRTDGYVMSVDEALRHLNIDQSLDSLDRSILPAIYDSARQDRPGETTNKAIETIAQAMSNLGGGDGSGGMGAGGVGMVYPPESWPVGLTSHGNTCYLNSLLQYYFSIRPLRDIVLDYAALRLDTAAVKEKVERVGQRKVSLVEIEGGQRFAADLRQLFERMIKSPQLTVKPEEDLVCRAFLDPQQYRLLDSDPEPNGTMTPDVNGDEEPVEITDDLTTDGPPKLPPRRRFSTAKALDIAQAKARQQQDVTEVHDGAMFRLRCGITPKGSDTSEEQIDSLRDLFSILIEDTVVHDGVEQAPKVLADSNIQLDVPLEPTDVYSALDAVFDLQPYGDGSAMETFKSIRAMPPLLQINIPRIGYSDTGAFKSLESMKLADELYLDRYFGASDPEILPKRRKCWAWRKQLRALELERKTLTKTPVDLDGPMVVSQTAHYLTSLDDVNRDLASLGVETIEADGDITASLAAEAEHSASRLNSLAAEIDVLQKTIDAEFADSKKTKYRLAAVFFHRGNQGHGHYWIYIHDFANDMWRIYNDEQVHEFTKIEQIFEANTYDHGTPTYAVYIAEDKLEMVQAVCRDPEVVEPEMETIPELEGVSEPFPAPEEMNNVDW